MLLSRISLTACEEHIDCIVAYGGNKYPFCVAEKNLEQAEQDVCDLNQEVEDLTEKIEKIS